MSELLLSLVIPTRDRPGSLRCLLEAIGFDDRMQVVVVDDGSTPENAAMNKAATVLLPGRLYIHHPLSRGAPRARNAGVMASSGRYLWFIDDDDLVPPATLDGVIHRLQSEGAELALLSSKIVENGVVVAAYQPRPERDNFAKYCAKGQLVSLPCIVMSRSLLTSAGGWDERLAAGQDTDLMLRLSKDTQPTCWSEFVVEIHVGHGRRLTNNLWRQQIAKLQILRKHWHHLTIRRKAYYIFSFLSLMPMIRRLTGRTVARELLSNREDPH